MMLQTKHLDFDKKIFKISQYTFFVTLNKTEKPLAGPFDKLRFVQGFFTKSNKEKIRDHGNCSVSAGVRFYQGTV